MSSHQGDRIREIAREMGVKGRRGAPRKKRLCAFSRPGSVHFICIDWRHLRELLAAGKDIYARLPISASGSSRIVAWGRANTYRANRPDLGCRTRFPWE
jgi:hypothetical protein